MAWTEITRPQYRRDHLRDASDTTDEEWKVIAPHLPAPAGCGHTRETDLRDLVNSTFYIAQTGCEWRRPSCSPMRSRSRGGATSSDEAEGAKDAADGQAIVTALDQQLKRGDKALIGNSAYRRYLRTTSDRRAFEIDPGKLAHEARYDGIFVLRTNARLTPLQAVLRYRDLIQVEACSAPPRR